MCEGRNFERVKLLSGVKWNSLSRQATTPFLLLSTCLDLFPVWVLANGERMTRVFSGCSWQQDTLKMGWGLLTEFWNEGFITSTYCQRVLRYEILYLFKYKAQFSLFKGIIFFWLMCINNVQACVNLYREKQILQMQNSVRHSTIRIDPLEVPIKDPFKWYHFEHLLFLKYPFVSQQVPTYFVSYNLDW